MRKKRESWREKADESGVTLAVQKKDRPLRKAGKGRRERMAFEHYVIANGKKLRCGFTTGTCAALAAQSCIRFLLTGSWPKQAAIRTPKGWLVEVEPQDCSCQEGKASCAIQKDGGDDVDQTDGALIYAEVFLTEEKGILIDGGEGVGRVTKPGLDQEVGQAAINSVPRQMIKEAAEDLFQKLDYEGGASIRILVPEGRKIAEKTFNPMLGIQGGISILGTSGIVEPMSMQALIDTIELELRQAAELGWRRVILTPGNYGLDFLQAHGIETGKKEAERRAAKEKGSIPVVRCSNFIGDALDLCGQLGFQELLLVGHIGKLVKLAGGIMNTHSRYADCRTELFCAHAAICGADRSLCQSLMEAATTDACLDLLEAAGLREQVMDSLLLEIERKLKQRTGEGLAAGALLFSNQYGELGRTKLAEEIIKKWQAEEEDFMQ